MLRSWPMTALWCLFLHSPQSVSAFRVAVFGGSGFIGRRICQTLVSSGCDVVSISRSGRPPSYWASGSWADHVDWVQADMALPFSTTAPSDDHHPLLPLIGRIDGAVSTVGGILPRSEWVGGGLGLGFDDDALRFSNGVINESIAHLAKEAGAKRFVLMGVSYEVAKALEGPIEGYLDGKRAADSAACRFFGEHNTVVIGPSLVYGGSRFLTFGRVYRVFVESFLAKAYVQGNVALRNLSVNPATDWVEAMIFSSPVEVGVVARVASAGVLGLVRDGVVGPRRQGFSDLNGKAIFYEDVNFVDGTKEIERVAEEVGRMQALCEAVNLKQKPSGSTSERQLFQTKKANRRDLLQSTEVKEPPFEGGLIGFGPYLRPLPFIALFVSIILGVISGQFIQVQQEATVHLGL